MASIRKRGKSYLLVVSMGYTPDGRRRNPQQKTVKPPIGLTPKQTEKWLQEQAMLFEMSCKKLNPDIDRSITLEKYTEIWKNFGLRIKVGAYANYGADKEKLRDLLMFYSAKEKKMISLKEYREAMPEGQEEIYYAAGANVDLLDKLPQAEMVRKHDYDILYLTADIDEFVINLLESQDEKKFRSITAGDLNLSSEEEKKEAEEKSTANRAMFDMMKEALDGKVKDVRVSSRLVNDPVCLTSDGNLSIEMERILNNVQNSGGQFNAEKILQKLHRRTGR